MAGRETMRRYVIVLLVLIALASAGVVSWRVSHRPTAIEWQGYAEADFVKVGPTQSGMLTAVRVGRGDRIAAGAALFDQDELDDAAACEQAKRQLDQATRLLADLRAPARPTEVAQAEANLADAVATRDRAEADLKRVESVVAVGAVSKQQHDQMYADLQSAIAKVNAETAALAKMRDSTGRDEAISAQAAAVEAAKAAVAMAEWRLSQRHVVAPKEAVVADVLARPGETIGAGAPVVSLLPPGNIFVRFFVSEAQLSSMHHGDSVELIMDGGPANLIGVISFISPQAEYTPPVIYSDQSRAKLVYMIEARPKPEQATLFNPGQPVTVRPVAKGQP